MKIILHNPHHNGDVLTSMECARNIIISNPNQNFVLIPACASFLYTDILKQSNVILKEHPLIWFKEKKFFSNINEYNDIIYFENLLWAYHNGDLYINLWVLMNLNCINCIEILDRVDVIKSAFENIYLSTKILLNFNVSDYKELIPNLPKIDIIDYENKINNVFLLNKNKQKIFFYNLNSMCGFEDCNESFNNDFILKILRDKNESLIIVPKICGIKNKNLICLEKDLNILPSHDALNLVINAAIANICNEVYFKGNGGSLFILNRINISNKNVKYYCLNNSCFKKTITESYGLECTWI